jgi:hypothetical protein
MSLVGGKQRGDLKHLLKGALLILMILQGLYFKPIIFIDLYRFQYKSLYKYFYI